MHEAGPRTAAAVVFLFSSDAALFIKSSMTSLIMQAIVQVKAMVSIHWV